MPSSPTSAPSSPEPALTSNSTLSTRSTLGRSGVPSSGDPNSPRIPPTIQVEPIEDELDEDPSIKFLSSLLPNDVQIHDTAAERRHPSTSSDVTKPPLYGDWALADPVLPSEEPCSMQPGLQQSAINITSNAIHVLESHSWISAHSAISVGTPLLQYDFHSAQTSPVVRPKFDGPDHVAVTTQLVLENEYSYVSIGSNQLRLLQLSKGRRGERIHCSLRILSDEQLETPGLVYQALSYAWGPDSDAIHDIFLRDVDIPEEGKTKEEFVILASHQMIPRRFYIRANLYHALQQLRSPTNELLFWIDAICIDQANDVEKSHQLGKMLDIYCNAHNVLIWIGDSEPAEGDGSSATAAMDFIPHLINLRSLDRMVSGAAVDERTAVSCRAFARLLRRPWFSRRWVIQEVAAARRASVQCGSRAVNWIDFADAVELFTANIGGIRSMYSGSAAARADPDALNSVESAGAKAIVSSANDILRRVQDGTVLDRKWSIETLVTTFLHFEASDPRDSIYALLALARDGHISPSPTLGQMPALKPDYTKHPVQTYIAFVQHCVIAGDSLDIICRHWALPLAGLSPARTRRPQPGPERQQQQSTSTSRPDRLPSWIGLASDSPFGPPSRFTGRLNGDSLVGEPGRPIYNSSRGATMAASFERHQPPLQAAPDAGAEAEADAAASEVWTEFSGRLRAAGLALGRVARATSRVVDGTVSDECLEMAGWEGRWRQHQDGYYGSGSGNINAIPDRLWRTLVADRAAITKGGGRGPQTPPPPWYRRACIYCLQKLSPEGDLNTARLLGGAALPGTVLEFLRRVQAVVWSRKFLLCRDLRDERAALLGLGPRYTREGDLICILYGCSVPVVLRPLGGSQYELMGECYIHGHMEGEAIAAMNQEALGKATIMFDII